MAGNKEQEIPKWRELLREQLGTLPDDYREAYSVLATIRHQVLEELAAALQKKMNSHFKSVPQSSLQDKQAIVKMINEDLRLLNLTVRCPTTGGPALLLADFRDNEDRDSRFRFQTIDPSGKRLKRNTSQRLPELQLTEAHAREENFSMNVYRPTKRRSTQDR